MEIEDLEWEVTQCDWCGSSAGDEILVGPDRSEHLPGIFRLVRCGSCGLIRQNPRLAWNSLKHYYVEGYSSHPPLIQDEKNFLRRLDRRYGPWKRLRAVEKYKKGGSLLDVGCGTGTFLEEAVHSGHWEAVGVDSSERAVAIARERLGIEVHQGKFDEIAFSQAAFDVVAMWNVLEHMDRPVHSLRIAYKLLKKDGILVLSVPNLEGLDVRVFGRYWLGWELPRHLYLFPRPLLNKILDEVGFQVVGMRCLSTSYSILGDSLNFWSQSWGTAHPTLRNLLLRTYRTLLVRAALVPPLWLQDRLNLSTIITLFAKKKAKYHLN